jgi:outer membrane immunogenic protein
MHRLLLALLISTAALGAANAADLPAAKPAPIPMQPVPTAYDWSGFYAGIDAGWAWAWSHWSDPIAGSSRARSNGGLVGGHLGYNWQRGSVVFGLETDAAWADISGNANAGMAFCATGPCDMKQNWIGTTRGRIGYAFNNWMPYLTGGAAYGDVHTNLPWGSTSSTRLGWSAGAGLEVGLNRNWSARLEYLHLDLGTASLFNAASGVSNVSIPVKDDLLRAGISYHW